MLFSLLVGQAKRYGERVAVVDQRRAVSYAQLLEEASKTASYLQSCGYSAGDAILIAMPPSVEFFAAFYGAAALGLVILPLLPSGRIPQVVIDREPLIACGEEAFLEQAGKLCRSIRGFLRWNREGGLSIPNTEPGFRQTKVYREEPAIGVSSSGTTGTPALYYRSQALMLHRGKLRAQILGITPDDVLLATRPFNSGSSINTHVVTPIVAGCKVVVQEKFQRFEAAETIDRENVTVLFAVPYIFELLASIPKSYAVDFSSLRLCISGGAALADSVAARFYDRFGIELQQLYGGSHIHPAFTCNLGGVRGSVGHTDGPFPIIILDEEGTPQGSEKIGEVAFDYTRIARPWKKYLRANPNRRGRYIHTGDLGRADQNGNVFIVGRKSKFIKVRGNRVEPAEVEAVLRSHVAVQEAFVYAMNHGEPTEAVAAIVCGRGVTELDLIRHCAQRLEGYKCPRKIAIRSSLPRNSHGKVALAALENDIVNAHGISD